VDDRTPQERGAHVPGGSPLEQAPHPQMAGGGKVRQRKSRYASVSNYIYQKTDEESEARSVAQYNDLDVPVDAEAFATLQKAGLDDILAQHVAHLFTRDPLVVFKERVELDDATCTDHFENIQSTNWQSCRWKPPPVGSDIGWRVEFRTMEIQLTDFENAAYR
jgi:glutamate--cysteine ligase catalytic subunit